MRFGGHETFWIREGWLYKGLKQLVENSQQLMDEYAADWLGVGRNMAKSIRHWLVATGLAVKQGKARNYTLVPTELGKVVRRNDLYFTDIGTWWMLHINLLHNPANALSWFWFFNRFSLTRFQKAQCQNLLQRHLQLTDSRLPSERTLDRDLACLLGSYSTVIPPGNEDPEEARDCPLSQLGLLTHFRDSDYYQLHHERKPIPLQVFGYAMSKAFENAADGVGMVDITLHDAVWQPGGPGRAFVLSSEALFETVLSLAEGADSDSTIQLSGLAGNRVIRIQRKSPLDWANEYYRRQVT